MKERDENEKKKQKTKPRLLACETGRKKLPLTAMGKIVRGTHIGLGND